MSLSSGIVGLPKLGGTTSFEDLTSSGSEPGSAIKAAGKLRLEGRKDVMRERDVGHFWVGR